MENLAFNMDCMEAMRSMPDQCFDLAVVDPPYGIGESGRKNKSRTNLAKATDYSPFFGEDKEPPPVEFFTQLARVSKKQIIFGANHFISRLPPPADTPCWIVWDKQNGGSDFADFEMAWTSFNRAARIFRFRWAGMLQGNMKNKEPRIHPRKSRWPCTHGFFNTTPSRGTGSWTPTWGAGPAGSPRGMPAWILPDTKSTGSISTHRKSGSSSTPRN